MHMYTYSRLSSLLPGPTLGQLVARAVLRHAEPQELPEDAHCTPTNHPCYTGGLGGCKCTICVFLLYTTLLHREADSSLLHISFSYPTMNVVTYFPPS